MKDQIGVTDKVEAELIEAELALARAARDARRQAKSLAYFGSAVKSEALAARTQAERLEALRRTLFPEGVAE